MKTRHFSIKFLFALLLTLSAPYFGHAADDSLSNKLPEETLFKSGGGVVKKNETKKNARPEDPAESYTLRKNGDFLRTINGHNVLFDTKVEDFKVSQHPHDVAFVYYIQRGNLKYISSSGKPMKPLFEKIKKIKSRYKYNVVPSTDTVIVNVALNESGEFRAWDNKTTVYRAESIKDYRMNSSFGSGRPFSSYVAFLIDNKGYITKVRGKHPQQSKVDYSRPYKSVAEFIEINEIQ